MKASLSSALALLLAGAAIASPVSPAEKKRMREIQKELDKLPLHGQIQPLHGVNGRIHGNATSPSGTVDSSNWGGISVPNSGITQVQATFTVPDVSLASGDNSGGPYYGCAWIGIDGDDSCSNGLWQAGAYWLYSNGGWQYFPFFEWYPGPVMQASMEISPGDSITVEIVADSTTSGTYYFTNNANGQTASGSLQNQPSLCEATAEWIVENNNNAGVEMPDFGSVTFNDASFVANGNTVGVSGGNTYVVDDNNQDYTNCGASGSSTVSCTWTGS